MKNLTQLFTAVGLTLLLLYSTAYAQSNPNAKAPMNKYNKVLKRIAQSEANIYNYKKTRSLERLTAMNRYSYDNLGMNYMIMDSTSYIYNSNYGYDPTPELFDFDYINTFLYSTQMNLFDKSMRYDHSGANFVLQDTTRNTFGTGHKLMNRYFDVFNTYLNNTKIQYNANDLKILEHDSSVNGATTNQYKYQFSHNANNKVNFIQGDEYSNNMWSPSERDSLYYDGNGRLSEVLVYTYDIGNNLWVKDYKVTYTYNAANKLLTDSSFVWDGNMWNSDYTTFYLYNANNKLLSSTSMTNNGGWVNDYKDSMMYSAFTYPDSRISMFWDAPNNVWQKNFKNMYTYSGSSQVQTAASLSWNNANNAWDPMDSTKYYYLQFTPEGLNNLNTLNAEIKLYPVPVAQTLFVNVTLDTKEKSEIFVVDINGNKVVNPVTNNDKSFTQTINVSHLASGNYILVVKGEHGSKSQMFSK